MTHADADSTGAMCGCPHPAHIHPAGSVAVVVNLDTTPVQLHTTPFQTAGTAGRGILRTYWYFLAAIHYALRLSSPQCFHQLLLHPGSPVGRYPGKVVMPLGVDPEAVIGYPVPLVTALIQRLQVTQDICVGDHVSRATAQDDRGTVPVEQLVDQNAHSLITTDPTAWLPPLEVGPQGFSRPGHRFIAQLEEVGFGGGDQSLVRSIRRCR